MQPTAPALDPFQLDTLAFLDHARGRAVIADPMGARKTGTILSWLSTTPCSTVLVVAPSAVHGHWAREAAKFYPEASVHHGTGSKVHREAERLRASYADSAEPSLYITTYESMKADQHAIELARFDTVVFDEGHALKGRRTQVALCANAVTAKAKHVIIATGTPVLNHAAELWQYLHMLAPKVYPAFWRWAEEHFRVEVVTFRGNRFPTTAPATPTSCATRLRRSSSSGRSLTCSPTHRGSPSRSMWRSRSSCPRPSARCMQTSSSTRGR
jgi:SNF2 family DNA or RNA helicase